MQHGTVNVFPIGLPELDYEVLMRMDDVTVARTCQTVPYVRDLCANDEFWHSKVLAKYPDVVNLRSRYPSWRDLYIAASHRGYLLVWPRGGYLGIYNNIQAAYQQYKGDMQRLGKDVPDLEQLQEAPGVSNSGSSGHIYLVRAGEEFPLEDSNHLLLSATYVDPGIARLPTFYPSTFVLYKLETPQVIGVAPLTADVLTRIAEYERRENLSNESFTIMNSDGSFRRYFNYSPETNVFLNADLPTVIIDGNTNRIGVLLDQNYGYLKIYPVIDHNNRVHYAPSRKSITDLFTLNPQAFRWEPLSNVSNYPEDPNFLS